MKKNFVALLCIIDSATCFAQHTEKPKQHTKPLFQWGLGVQDLYPYYGLSVKYAITQHSVVEATLSPGGTDNYGLSFYGLRYLYRFGFTNWHTQDGMGITAYPYLFGGVGRMGWDYSSYSYNSAGEWSVTNNTHGSLAFAAGVGYEVILFRHFGINAEAGWGQFYVDNDAASLIFTFGGGLHWYFGGGGQKMGYQGTTVMGPETADNLPDDDEQANAARSDNADQNAGSDMADEDSSMQPAAHLTHRRTHLFFSGDFGGCTLHEQSNDFVQNANGASVTLSANYCHQLGNGLKHRRLLSYGIEGRSEFPQYTFTDGLGGNGYDHYRLWYVGIPVNYTYISRSCLGRRHQKMGMYGQVGVSVDVKLGVSETYNDENVTTTTDISSDFSTLAASASVSGGFSVEAKSATWLIGPYAGYNFTNLTTSGGVTDNMIRFGLRLTFMPDIVSKL